MKVDTQPFPGVNIVESCDRSTRRQLDFALGINMAGVASRHQEEEYEHRTGKRLKKHEDARDHWHCLFFRYCWDSGMNRLPTIRDCPECGPVKSDAKGVSVFRWLGPIPTRQEWVRSPRRGENFDEEEDRKEWQPKSTRADKKRLADTHMVFVLPAEFHARAHKESSVAQLDLGPRPVIFEKPQAKNYKHLKALYLKGYINGQPINKMLVDTGAAGVLSVDLTIGNKTVLTSFFVVNSKSTYNVLLGRDWIHTNCCIPSTMHQCLIQWDGDEVEVVQADDSIEISHAAMSIWDAEDQESISGMSLEGCDRIEATKNGVRLVLSTGLTE
ncbi:hypothetical protein GQ55_3G334500 [Panicum hallii var. hallii]|uniref:Peptidase A2 domain-containing protein n=1 Tax=Panicum hallii var. hallii TaxID=1504633 RepID=A0A2T7EFM3_9POAL|nr:hypothetical protein GQ55_3G334500 [Panicum hallii var. hallii]